MAADDQQVSIPDNGGVPGNGQANDLDADCGGALAFDAEETFSQESFETAASQGL